MSSQTSERYTQGLAPASGVFAAVFLLSAATLMFEIALTRLFSVAQFYHFAFMIVSLAMLGFGASGTWLALRQKQDRSAADLSLVAPTPADTGAGGTVAGLALGCGLSAVGAYLLINWVPFDSFSIAWDWRQALLLGAQYLVLSIPFFCSGAVLGSLLTCYTHSVGPLYAVNLVGSAMGCVLALLLPALVGGEGVIWLSGALSGCAALLLAYGAGASMRRAPGSDDVHRGGGLRPIVVLSVPFVLCCVAVSVASPAAFTLRLSPYKGLSYALQVPDSVLITSNWNGYSRVDLVDSSAIRSLPGLSYRYLGPPPPQLGLFVDGDDASPVVRVFSDPLDADDGRSDLGMSPEVTGYLPSAVAYALRPDARALVTAPGGGLEVWIALSQGVREVTVVESNPLIVDAVGSLYENSTVAESRLMVVLDDPRSYIRRATLTQQLRAWRLKPVDPYDIVMLALTAPYRPIRSGAYSLGEDYRYTVEAFVDYLSVLNPDGLLVVSRWVQMPPSESLRVFALAVEAVERLSGDAAKQIVAFRGYAMMTLLISPTPFTAEDLATIRRFAADRAFDMVYAPDIRVSEVNRYNVLPSPVYYDTFTELAAARDRKTWYAAYAFDVRPPNDDHPFFGHFFKWSQAGQIIAELGQSWQPFGGAGYFVLVALLILAVAAATVLMGLPVIVARLMRNRVDDRVPRRLYRRGEGVGRQLVSNQLYFGLLGIGFLFVEIPLMQRAILFLGHPSYAVTVVLFSLLFFSGLGSYCSARAKLPLARSIGALVAFVLLAAALLPPLFSALLWLPWWGRVGVTVFALGPVGFFMGMPFPAGLKALEQGASGSVPGPYAQVGMARAWAANGALSVVASILSALLALSFGFTCVLILGALSYTGAALIAVRWRLGSHGG